MRTSVVIHKSAPADSLLELLANLEPGDLVALRTEFDRIRELRATVADLLGLTAPAPTARPHSAAEVNELERHLLALDARVAEQGELLDRIAEEVAGLHGLALSQAERIAAQSESLSKRAERAPENHTVVAVFPDLADGPAEYLRANSDAAGAQAIDDYHHAERLQSPTPVADALLTHVAAAGAVTVIDDAEADLAPPVSVSAAPKQRRTSEGKRAKRIALARALAAAPQRMSDLCKALEMPDSTTSYLLAHEWFTKVNGKFSPYTLTDAGRAALAADGYVLVPPAAPEPTPAPDPSPKPTAMDALLAPKQSLDGQERRKAQVLLIARAIAASEHPLEADQIAKAAGLPYELVTKWLNRYGPSSLGLRYFCKSARDANAWRLTNSGTELLAKEGAQQQ